LIAGTLVCGLLVAGAALAMGSDNYAINLTVGQTVVGASSSTSYGARLGYWCGGAAGYWIYLTLVLRSFS
jgi:hypothetical protein